jgi:hypothetical protein
MFIRRKVVRGTAYYAVVENQRQDGRVRQRTVISLAQHPTVEAALKEAHEVLAGYQAKADTEHRRHLARIKMGLLQPQDYRVRQGFRAQKEADKWKKRIVRLETAQAVVSKKEIQ